LKQRKIRMLEVLTRGMARQGNERALEILSFVEGERIDTER